MLKDRLILLRKQKNLSQYEAAEKLGYSRGKLANYEQGSRQPDYGTLEDLANFYDVTVDYLLGRTNNPNSSEDDNDNSLHEINQLLKKYGIDQSGFFDIEKWKNMGPEEIRELENYFEYISEKAKNKEQQD